MMRVFFLLLVLCLEFHVYSQSAFISGQDSLGNPILVAVPFLTFAPDSRSSGMGDMGVATSPDANSIHWNNAKLAFLDSKIGGAISHSPWLGNLVDDMSLNYISFYTKIKNIQAIGFSFRYFDFGDIFLYDEFANSNGIESPNELALDATYSRKVGKYSGLGLTFRYISSNLAGSITGANSARVANSVAFDLGWYYSKSIKLSSKMQNAVLSFGAHISNFGQKIAYSSGKNSLNFLPGNFRFGSNLRTNFNLDNSLSIGLEFHKLLVPTPPKYEYDASGQVKTDANGNKIIAEGKDPNRSLLSGVFGSFGDAPRGMKEEFEELQMSLGTEYWYKDRFALRLGYFFEHKNKGGRQYVTLGGGFRYTDFGIDLSYLIPTGRLNNSLANTLRFTLSLNVKRENVVKDTR